MESTYASSLFSSLLPLRPSTPRRSLIIRHHQLVRMTIFAAAKSSGEQDKYWGNGRMVDENLIVLRKRIHEMKMVERNYEPPANWMDWEKKYYTSYDSMICEAMGFLQAKLMDSRPSHVLPIAFVIALSVPTSFTLLLLRLLDSL